MYPLPVEKWKPVNRLFYKASLPLALIVWLLPLLAVMLTSVRSSEELMRGNYWGWPNELAFVDNYRMVLVDSPMLHYFWNSCLITFPSVLGAMVLSATAGFALATYPFKGNTAILATFVAGNFVPVQILMIPVRDLTLRMGMFNTV